MVIMSFVGHRVPDIRRKLQKGKKVIGMKPTQLVDIVYKVIITCEGKRLNRPQSVESVEGRDGKKKSDF